MSPTANSITSSYVHLAVITLAVFPCVLPFLPIPSLRPTRKAPRRDKLPPNVYTWRLMNTHMQLYNIVWDELRPLLEDHGFRLWRNAFGSQCQDGSLPQCDNFLYLTPNKIMNWSLTHWKGFMTTSRGHRHAARMNGVRDVVLRVVTAGGEGESHLRILRRLSSPPNILMSNNHILPVLCEVVFEDIVIAVFPKLIYNMYRTIEPVVNNSVEDILYMMLQAFEGVAYLHSQHICHRDMFIDNIMVEWFPQSLNERAGSNRPRVYIIDFETAIEFPEDSSPSQRLCFEPPIPLDIYSRHIAPELQRPEPYCPFRLDMWQLGIDLHNEFQTPNDEVNKLWADLVAPVPEDRITAAEAVKRLDDFLRRTVPNDLHVKMCEVEAEDAEEAEETKED